MKFKRKSILTLAWALLLAPAFVLMLSGCAATADQYPARTYDVIDARIHIVDKLPENKPDSVIGYAVWRGDQCEIWVLKRVYPHAVMHEIMHCFSGNWHEGRKSAEFQHIIE